MKKKTDKELGMHARISRRDLLHDAALAAVGLSLAPGSSAETSAGAQLPPSVAEPQAIDYPPVRTGLRGSHPGAFEAAHALRDGGAFPTPAEFEDGYDLVIVGAGISGLAAAHYYQKRYGADAKILLLENHDDFGGHAKRNEFHQGGEMRLSLGGTHNLEWWSFSRTVKKFMREHDVDPQAMRKKMQFSYGRNPTTPSATWFDAETYGEDKLLVNFDLSETRGPSQELIDEMPISEAGRESLKRLYTQETNVLADMPRREREPYLRSISYPEFLQRHCGLSDDAVQLFNKLEHGGWGVELRALSAQEGMESGLPGSNFVGRGFDEGGFRYPVAMWPDGNASLVRLQVAKLIPDVSPLANADNIALAEFDYSKLDRPGNNVRLRLSSTVIRVEDVKDEVQLTYMTQSGVAGVKAKHCVMACYHSIIPHLCPGLPAEQAEAMRYQVKHPLLLTNVLLRNTQALDALGIDSVQCPGRLHHSLFAFRGINTGGYHHDMDDKGPVPFVFWGSISPPDEAIDIKDQLRASRTAMLSLRFEDYEREVRTVLDGLLGPVGFDVERDILAITVNRWPHGYAYDYLDLWDPDWAEGEAPHEIARQPFGRITIANADAAADAYTHAAIDQAYRAVKDLPRN